MSADNAVTLNAPHSWWMSARFGQINNVPIPPIRPHPCLVVRTQCTSIQNSIPFLHSDFSFSLFLTIRSWVWIILCFGSTRWAWAHTRLIRVGWVHNPLINYVSFSEWKVQSLGSFISRHVFLRGSCYKYPGQHYTRQWQVIANQNKNQTRLLAGSRSLTKTDYSSMSASLDSRLCVRYWLRRKQKTRTSIRIHLVTSPQMQLRLTDRHITHRLRLSRKDWQYSLVTAASAAIACGYYALGFPKLGKSLLH